MSSYGPDDAPQCWCRAAFFRSGAKHGFGIYQYHKPLVMFPPISANPFEHQQQTVRFEHARMGTPLGTRAHHSLEGMLGHVEAVWSTEARYLRLIPVLSVEPNKVAAPFRQTTQAM